MKALLCVALACVGLTAFGQTRGIIHSTNVAAAATATMNAAFGTSDALEVGFGFSLALTAAVGVNSNVTVSVQKTIDGTNWNAFATCILPTSGATVQSFWTNFSVGGIPELRISTTVNANTSAIPAITFWRSIKRLN